VPRTTPHDDDEDEAMMVMMMLVHCNKFIAVSQQHITRITTPTP
jgi:hypothetical protein